MLNLNQFFPHLDEFAHREIFGDIEAIWDPLKILGELIDIICEKKTQGVSALNSLKGTIQTRSGDPGARRMGPGVYVERWLETESPVFLRDLEIFIGEGTVLEPSAIIKGPAVIGAHCEVRQGAYIRGNVITGDHCTIGHNTEIKNSVFMNHAEAGHFNYIGDSIVGSYVNLGAGSKLANLQFRTLEEKRDGKLPLIEIPIDKQMVPTGLGKLGSILGDGVEIGCNAVLSPGTLIGANNWVYPNMTVPKGYYPPGFFLLPVDRRIRSVER